jgi:hypothetical protein
MRRHLGDFGEFSSLQRTETGRKLTPEARVVESHSGKN